MKIQSMFMLFFLLCSCIFSHRKKRVELMQSENHQNVKYACYQTGIRILYWRKALMSVFCRQIVCSNVPFSCRKAFLFCF